jgi:hypothetical protein
MTSRYLEYEPGDKVPVEVTDPSTSSAGDLVEISGEATETGFTEVQQATDDAAAFGMLVTDPNESTTDDMVRVFKPIIWLSAEGSYTATAGDLVAERAGGTVSDTLGDGTTAVSRSDAYGQVASTNVRELHVGDRIAVAVYR